MHNLKVKITLDQLICHRKGRMKGWRKTAPYMWNIFFKISNPHLKVNQKFRLYGNAKFHFSKGSHGNLKVYHMDAKQTALIPEEIGVWEDELHSIDVPFFNYEAPGLIGVVTVLMEQHNVSKRGAEAGHRSLNDYVKKSMNTALHDFDVTRINVKDIENSIKDYFDEELERFIEDIETKVGGAVVKAQNIIQNIWSLIGKDELIGFKVWYFNNLDIEECGLNIELSTTFSSYAHGEWEITGKVEAEII